MYKTELMEKILKSPKAWEIVQKLSPIYGEAYVALWLLQVIGTVLDEMDEWASSLRDQVTPNKATWSLPLWEEQYHLVTDPTWSNERRRNNILNKCVTRAPINPKKMESIIEVAANADARVEELTGKNRFTVYISSVPGKINEELVKKEINTAKPSHLIYNIVYEKYVEGAVHIGGTIHTAKEITLTQF